MGDREDTSSRLPDGQAKWKMVKLMSRTGSFTNRLYLWMRLSTKEVYEGCFAASLALVQASSCSWEINFLLEDT